MNGIFAIMRPKQYVKNVFVLLPLFFAGQITDTVLLVNGLVAPEKFDKVINNLKKFKSVCNGNGIEIYPSPALMEIIELLTFE